MEINKSEIQITHNRPMANRLKRIASLKLKYEIGQV